eukprot:g81607.t1
MQVRVLLHMLTPRVAQINHQDKVLDKDVDDSSRRAVFSRKSTSTSISSREQPFWKQDTGSTTSETKKFTKKRSFSSADGTTDAGSEPPSKRKRDYVNLRLDDTKLSPSHQKRLAKSRRYQAKRRKARQAARTIATLMTLHCRK